MQVIKDFQAEIKGAQTFAIIDALGSLQQSLCAAGGMSMFVMQLLAREVEEHLAPCPDAATMKEFSDDLVKIGSGTFGSKPVPISEWSQWKWLRNTNFAEEDKWMEDMFKDKEAEFDLHIFKVVVTDGLMPKYWEKSILFQSFINMLGIAISSGRSGYMQHAGGVDGNSAGWMASLYDESRTLLPWTTIGFVVKHWLRKEILAPRDVCGGTLPFEVDVHKRFDKLTLVRIPQFVAQASELLDVLECQLKEVQHFRATLMAYGVTAALTAGQFLVAIFNRWLEDNDFVK